MGRPCTICTHAQKDAINQALAEGYSFRDVAGSYAVSKTALHRHWQAHIAAAPAGAPVAPARASGTARPPMVKWGLWVATVVVGLWLIGRAAEPTT